MPSTLAGNNRPCACWTCVDPRGLQHVLYKTLSLCLSCVQAARLSVMGLLAHLELTLGRCVAASALESMGIAVKWVSKLWLRWAWHSKCN
jgi:hypothetical protein